MAKAKREREAGGGGAAAGGGSSAAAAPAAPKVRAVTGKNANVDLFGTMRGAHKTPGVCAGFARVWTKNENDMAGFNCAHCGKPSSDHEDLGPAPVDEDAASLLRPTRTTRPVSPTCRVPLVTCRSTWGGGVRDRRAGRIFSFGRLFFLLRRFSP